MLSFERERKTMPFSCLQLSSDSTVRNTNSKQSTSQERPSFPDSHSSLLYQAYHFPHLAVCSSQVSSLMSQTCFPLAPTLAAMPAKIMVLSTPCTCSLVLMCQLACYLCGEPQRVVRKRVNGRASLPAHTCKQSEK